MRVTVVLHLELEDYAKLDTISEIVYLIQTFLTLDEDRAAFGRIIANHFHYRDVELARDFVNKCCFSPDSNQNADRAKTLIDAFIRDLWDDLRTHHMGGVLMERFGGGVVVASH